MRGRTLTFIAMVVALFGSGLVILPAAAAAQTDSGVVVIDADVPDGGVALIELRSSNGDELAQAVTVAEDGTIEVDMPVGNYRVVPRQMSVDGERFVAGASRLVVNVRAGESVSTSVTYERSAGVQNLRVVELGEGSISLDWDADLGDETTVWRTEGQSPVTKSGQGTNIALTDSSSLTDTAVDAGTVYTYTIFARPGDGAFGRDDVDPVWITVSTEDDDSSTPLFALSAGSRILDASEFTPFSTGDGLVLELVDGVGTPTPGSILLLPATAELPGGYIGEVVGVSSDGRFVELVFAPMQAAFDLYHLDVPDISVLPDPEFAPGAPPGLPEGESAEGFMTAAATKPECGDVAEGLTITPDLAMEHNGWANITIDKWKIRFFPDVPHTLSFDVGYSTTLSATVDVEASIEVVCEVPGLDRFYKQVAVYPVPIGLEADPSAELSVFGGGSVENLGATVTAGFTTDGELSVTDAPRVGGDLILEPNATVPTFSGELGVGLEIGGEVTFGPGVGSKEVGLVLGVKGQFTPLDASGRVVSVEKQGQTDVCFNLEANLLVGMSASLRAWVPGYEKDYSVTVDELQGEFAWPGSPYWYPNDCTQSGTPTNDVVGDNLTVIDDEIVGDDDQFGKIEGLIPGEDTWVLSTGRIGDLVGSPSEFASTNLGGAGDPTLAALVGGTTYDAVAYQVTVVPDGETLVVRYAFGSEEYPEYVGSQFNDVMAVFVNGANCALVPNTSTPVSINSINQSTNSAFYVDNVQGAAGYNTTLDGVTVPIECRVPVEIGQPVTIKIAVADTSDGIYDSAVALLDGGIFAE